MSSNVEFVSATKVGVSLTAVTVNIKLAEAVATPSEAVYLIVEYVPLKLEAGSKV